MEKPIFPAQWVSARQNPMAGIFTACTLETAAGVPETDEQEKGEHNDILHAVGQEFLKQ